MGLAIFAAVNILFLFKYSMRIDPNGIVAIAVSAIYAAFLIYLSRCRIKNVNRTGVAIALASYSIIGVIILQYIPLSQFKVDRWEIIQLFWQTAEHGGYPYSASIESTGNMPGASPVYFLISYPFYKFNAYGLMAISVPWIWWFGMPGLDSSDRLKGLVMICTAPSLLYEIMTRSTLWFNSMLVLVFCVYLLNLKKWDTKTIIINAIIGGLLLNTRTIYVIPYLVIWFSMCRDRSSIRRLLLWGCTAAVTYVSAFVAMALIWGATAVIENNPFTVQGANLYPAWFMISLVAAAIIAGILTNKDNGIFISGALMFVSTLYYLILVAARHGIFESISGSYADITYFCFCLPFLLYKGKTYRLSHNMNSNNE